MKAKQRLVKLLEGSRKVRAELDVVNFIRKMRQVNVVLSTTISKEQIVLMPYLKAQLLKSGIERKIEALKAREGIELKEEDPFYMFDQNISSKAREDRTKKIVDQLFSVTGKLTDIDKEIFNQILGFVPLPTQLRDATPDSLNSQISIDLDPEGEHDKKEDNSL